MIRIVLDTNVIVSALIKPESIPEFVFDLIIQDFELELIFSTEILHEYKTVLSYGKFNKYLRRESVIKALAAIKKAGQLIEPKRDMVLPQLVDLSDIKFLACAVTGKAKYLVTGNIRHFPKHKFAQTHIITPRAFLDEQIKNGNFFDKYMA